MYKNNPPEALNCQKYQALIQELQLEFVMWNKTVNFYLHMKFKFSYVEVSWNCTCVFSDLKISSLQQAASHDILGGINESEMSLHI